MARYLLQHRHEPDECGVVFASFKDTKARSGGCAGVAVHGEASAKLPILLWVASGLLLAATAPGFVGDWVLARAIRREDEPVAVAPDEPQRLATACPRRASS